jgi:serine/threonine protein kinase
MLQEPTGTEGSGSFPRVFGSVALLKPLARDARTEVFLALRQEGADRLCVVTLLAPALLASPVVIDALRAQATWLVDRVHGNLVQIYDVGQSGEQLFFVSEYVEGADLGALLDRAGPLEPGVAAFTALEVGEAIAFVRGHEEASTQVPSRIAGLSAASVIVARDGSVKLLHQGSGLAASADELAARGAAVASLVAPEHVLGGGSAAGDVFAIGALLWQMLTARPLAGTDAAAHIARLRSGAFTPEAPSKVVGPEAGIPEALDRLVTAALAPRPEDRPADFEALRAELVAVVRSVAGGEERGIRRVVGEAFGVELGEQSKEIARLAAEASKPLETGPQLPPLTLTTMSGVRRPQTSDEPDLVLGDTIPGTRYRALEKLGEGGMGAVYLAEHVDIERKVALKLLHGDLVQNPLVLRQFRQEARAASRIGNPYICDVTDWGEVQDGRVFFVMEYLDGTSLGTELKERGRLPIERLIPILRQVAKALGAAHEKGIVHLDVKPDNVILMERNGRGDAVKVVDFGIAGLLGQGGGGAKVMGTPEYMAPERAQGLGYDHRSDVYSLGVMAWEMIVGEVPFQSTSAVGTLALHVDDTPDRINERLTQPIPEEIEVVVMRMLAKDPLRRPPSMSEVEALLIEAQLAARIRTPWDEELTLPPMDPDRAVRIARQLSPIVRRTRLSLAAASVVAAASVSLAVYFAVRSPEASQARGLGPSPSANPPATVIVATQPVPPTAPPGPTLVTAPPVALEVPAPAPGEEPAEAPAAPPGRRRREERVASVATASPKDQAKARALYDRGHASLLAGRYVIAEKELSEAVVADPQNPLAQADLAETAFENAHFDVALRAARAAARLGAKVPRHHRVLGDVFMKFLQYDQALRAYQKAQTLAPNDKEIKSRIEMVKARMGAGGR